MGARACHTGVSVCAAVFVRIEGEHKHLASSGDGALHGCRREPFQNLRDLADGHEGTIRKNRARAGRSYRKEPLPHTRYASAEDSTRPW